MATRTINPSGRTLVPGLFFVGLALVLAVTFLVDTNAGSAVPAYRGIAVLASMTAVLIPLYLLRSRLAPAIMSPVFINALGLMVMGVLGFLFYGVASEARQGASAEIELTQTESLDTLWLMTLSACSLIVGAAAVLYIMPRTPRAQTVSVSARNLNGLLLIGSAALCMITLASSGKSLWQRSEYITEAVSNSGILGLISQLTIGAVIVLGYLSATGRPAMRIASIIVLMGYVLIFFGAGSRKLALVPILFVVGMIAAKRGRRVVPIILAALLALYLLQLPLYLRGLPSHGVLPYLNMLPGFFDFDAGWAAVMKNLLFSFGIIGSTAFQQDQISADIFWMSVNPAPGSWVGWYDQAASLRVNPYTPYAGVGELGNHGYAYTIAYYLCAGAVLGMMDRAINRLMAQNSGLLGLALLGLSGLFLLYSFQYNLRASSRMLVYSMIAAVILTWIGQRAARRSRPGTPR